MAGPPSLRRPGSAPSPSPPAGGLGLGADSDSARSDRSGPSPRFWAESFWADFRSGPSPGRVRVRRPGLAERLGVAAGPGPGRPWRPTPPGRDAGLAPSLRRPGSAPPNLDQALSCGVRCLRLGRLWLHRAARRAARAAGLGGRGGTRRSVVSQQQRASRVTASRRAVRVTSRDCVTEGRSRDFA